MPSTKKPSRPPAPAKPARKRVDWEAVERDYRTGKFTLRELEKKHGASYSEISRKAKREGWQKDLRQVIRAATDASLLRNTATKAQRSATDVVLVAAEQNTQIILSHRRQLRELGEYADKARAKLMELGDSVADVREAVALMAGIESYNRILKARIEKEREAFALDDEGSKPPPAPVDWAAMPGDQAEAAYKRLVHGQ